MKSYQAMMARRLKFSHLRRDWKKYVDEHPAEVSPEEYQNKLAMLNYCIQTLDWCMQDDTPDDFRDIQAFVSTATKAQQTQESQNKED